MKTYALTLENGKIVYIEAKARNQAIAIWTRSENDKIASIKIVTGIYLTRPA
jgi:hypothetical protein